MTLDELGVGNTATIVSVGGEGTLRRHLLDMGLTPGTKVMIERIAPLGDPLGLQLRGYALTLRKEDARAIAVEV